MSQKRDLVMSQKRAPYLGLLYLGASDGVRVPLARRVVLSFPATEDERTGGGPRPRPSAVGPYAERADSHGPPVPDERPLAF